MTTAFSALRARSLLFTLLAALATLIAGCGGKGSSAPAPTALSIVVGDGRATLTWTAQPGVEYWLFYAAADGVTPDNWTQLSNGNAVVNVTSPHIVAGLLNGQKYSFSINGRTGGGPGGPGTLAQTVTPRLAGSTWIAGAPVAGAEFNAVATGGAAPYVAVGQGGVIYTSADGGLAWTVRTSGTTKDLNGVATLGSLVVAVGQGGTALYSSNAGETWTAGTTGTTVDLKSVALSTGGLFAAVGAGGVIYSSPDGAAWTARTSGAAADLLGVAFVNSTFVATGAAGTVLTSPDGVTWTNRTIAGAGDVRSAAYGAAKYVVVGDNGAIYTSADAITFAKQTSTNTQHLYGVISGSQLIAVGNAGTVLNSTDAITWNVATSNSTAALRGVASRDAGYAVVGRAGATLTSK
jgi:hypothetical protein